MTAILLNRKFLDLDIISDNAYAMNGLTEIFKCSQLCSFIYDAPCVLIITSTSLVSLYFFLSAHAEIFSTHDLIIFIGAPRFKKILYNVGCRSVQFMSINDNIIELRKNIHQILLSSFLEKNETLEGEFGLTMSEVEVLDLLMAGQPPVKIAKDLGIDVKKVSRKKRSAMNKYHVSSVVELAFKYLLSRKI